MSEPVHSGFYFTTQRHRDTYPAINPVDRDFSGKYVFITGASKGIGEQTALSYAQAGVEGIGIGARSDLSSLVPQLVEAATSAGKKLPKVVALQLDMTDEASVDAAAKKIAESFPRLDILINNAGYLETRAKIRDQRCGQFKSPQFNSIQIQ